MQHLLIIITLSEMHNFTFNLGLYKLSSGICTLVIVFH